MSLRTSDPWSPVWQSPSFSGISGRLPRQRARWLAMTALIQHPAPSPFHRGGFFIPSPEGKVSPPQGGDGRGIREIPCKFYERIGIFCTRFCRRSSPDLAYARPPSPQGRGCTFPQGEGIRGSQERNACVFYLNFFLPSHSITQASRSPKTAYAAAPAK